MSAPANQTLEHLVRYQKAYVIILLLAILILPHLFRYPNSTIIGESSYFHLNAAENYPHQLYHNPYHFLISFNFLYHPFLYQAVPFILAFLSLFLLFSIIKELKLDPVHQFYFLFFLIISPAFIYTFTVLNHYSLIIFLNLLGFHLLFQKKRIFDYLSVLVFLIIPFFDFFSSLLTLSLLAVYLYFKNRKLALASWPKTLFPLKEKNLLEYLVIAFVLLSLANLFLLKKPFLLGPYTAQSPANLFSDFGSLFGTSLFAFLLALLGLFFTWKKRKTYLVYPFLGFFFLLFFYHNSTLVYFNFPIIFFASSGFIYLYRKEWQLDLIKNLSLFLLILGLLFSTLTAVNNLSSLPPSPEMKESLAALNELPAYQVIFSHPQDSYLIEYFSHKPVFVHYHDPDFKARLNITSQIFSSTYIKDTFPLLEENRISHLYLSSQTLAGLPTGQGLIFLLQNERFKRIYAQDDYEIWGFR